MKQIVIALFLCVISIELHSQTNTSITPETALQAYLNNGDKSFKWKLLDKSKEDKITFYRLALTSQTWRNIVWKHELTIMVPDDVEYKDALLFISGGHLKDGEPQIHQWNDKTIKALGEIAQKNKSITAIIWQVPNQPLFNGLVEDQIISYTFHHFQQDHDYTWPLLFPMTKSALRAMDAIQEFAEKNLTKEVDNFVVSGISKRGWTTWFTGASQDKRVKAIAPIVIDMLNMPVNIPYQKEAWGKYSEEIMDYVRLGITEVSNSPEGKDLVKMVDPYSYRKNLTMPKMIFIGTNDQYWPVDALKNYIDSIPGDNHFCYVPNVGHNMGDKTKMVTTLNAFFGETITDKNHPIFKYSVSDKNKTITLKIKATLEYLEDVVLWCADSDDRDFRDEEWTEKDLGEKNKDDITISIPFPESGYKAFYIDLKYNSPFNIDYTQSTRMFLTDSKGLYLK